MGFIIFIVVILILIGFSVLRNNAIKNNGIEVKAKISRIEKDESSDDGNITYHHYVSYEDKDGNLQEAMILNKLNKHFELGEELTIRYLPERKKEAVIIDK